jgi:hypothetical protein
MTEAAFTGSGPKKADGTIIANRLVNRSNVAEIFDTDNCTLSPFQDYALILGISWFFSFLSIYDTFLYNLVITPKLCSKNTVARP